MKAAVRKKPLSDVLTRKLIRPKLTPVPKIPTIPVFPTGYTFLQPKLLCPCDGGCPICAPLIQAKLKVGSPNDNYELEADRIADAVMRMPESEVNLNPEEEELIQTKPLAEQITPLIQRQVEVEEEEEEEKLHQPKEIPGQTPEVTPDLESQVQSLRGGGQPLPESTRAFFEPRFGYDFSRVRVHTDPRSAKSASALNARSFTVGKDVVFGPGQYAPETTLGKRLLAHELTHVLQQSSSIPFIQRSPLTEEEKQKDLTSEKYAWNHRLQKVYDNNPPMSIGETGEAVRLVQEGLAEDGIALPISTNKETGELDGIFGQETYRGVQEFQYKHASDGLLDSYGRADGIVGRNTMGKLDELARQGKVLPLCPDYNQVTDEQPTGSPPGQGFESTEASGNFAIPCAIGPGGKKPTPAKGKTKCPPFRHCSNPDVMLNKPYIVFVLCKTKRNINNGPGSISSSGCPPQWSAAPGWLIFTSESDSNVPGWELEPELEYLPCRLGEENKWEWGFIQTVEYSIMGGHFSNNQRHFFTAVQRARDARTYTDPSSQQKKGAPSPWYDKPGEKCGPWVVAQKSPVINDSPRIGLCVKHKNSNIPDLHRVFMKGTFYTWLIVKRIGVKASAQTVDFLHHWRFDMDRSWDFCPSDPTIHPCTIGAWVALGGQKTAFEGVGKGPGSPVWDTPVANLAQKKYWLDLTSP